MDIWIVSILKNISKQDILLLMPWHTAWALLWAAFLEVGDTIKFNRQWRSALPKRKAQLAAPTRGSRGSPLSSLPCPPAPRRDRSLLSALIWFVEMMSCLRLHLRRTREHLLTGLLAFFREWPFRVLFNIFSMRFKMKRQFLQLSWRDNSSPGKGWSHGLQDAFCEGFSSEWQRRFGIRWRRRRQILRLC